MQQESPSTGSQKFQALVLSLLFITLIAWVIKISKDITMPILAAIIWTYIITSTANALGRLPIIKNAPLIFRRLLVLLVVIVGFVIFGTVIIVTIEQIIAIAPSYQANLEQLMLRASALLGVEDQPNWQVFINETWGQINLKNFFAALLISFVSLGGSIALVLIYASFLIAERNGFTKKLVAALPTKFEVTRTQSIMQDINDKIGDYLAIKTLINVILAAISYIIMWSFGIDFALFWALLVGVLNYIPYIGSLIAVFFPVVLSMAQFASFELTISLTICLIFIQWLIGNVVEPKLIGKQTNLSPFVVIVSLSIWFELLGVGGAILAIPLTSILAIILSAFKPTKPFAIMLAQNIDDKPK